MQLPLTGTVAAADGLPMAYTVDGPAEADPKRPTLVFIHGWSCDRSHWDNQVVAFQDRYRVLTLDLPGHGDSGAERESWQVTDLDDDLAAALEALTEEGLLPGGTVLIGHSMGAPVAAGAAVVRPAGVRAVIAVDSLQSVEPMNKAQLQPMVEAFEADFAGTCGQFVNGFFLEGSDPAVLESVRANMCEGPPEVVVPLFASFFDVELHPILTSLDVPLRLINSSLFPTQLADQLSADEVDLQVRILPNSGHFLMLAQPEAFNALLAETLDDLATPAGAVSQSIELSTESSAESSAGSSVGAN